MTNAEANIASSWYNDTLLKQEQLLLNIPDCQLSVQEKNSLGTEISQLLAEYENLLLTTTTDPNEVLSATLQLLKKFISYLPDLLGSQKYDLEKQLDKTLIACFASNQIDPTHPLSEKDNFTYGFMDHLKWLNNDLIHHQAYEAIISKNFNDDDFYRYTHLSLKKRWHKDDLTQPTTNQKIPRILHQIWLTNPKEKAEISLEDLQYIFNTHALISQGMQQWTHIIWTNDKSLIPLSREQLEAHGIQVREFGEIEPYLKLSKEIRELIEVGVFKMASDLLRYDIINYSGGFYTDINFELSPDVSQKLEEIINRFDFYNTVIEDNTYPENSAFLARANHPILQLTLDIIDKKFNQLPIGYSSLIYYTMRIKSKIPPEDDIYGAPLEAPGKVNKLRFYHTSQNLIQDPYSFRPFQIASLKAANLGENVDIPHNGRRLLGHDR